MSRTWSRVYWTLLCAAGVLVVIGAAPAQETVDAPVLWELLQDCPHPLALALALASGILLPQPGKVARIMDRQARDDEHRRRIAADLDELRSRREADQRELAQRREKGRP